ncbi:MAG: hypothetical protein JWM31_137 [Solirubrobacterales bacterium]|nr:hypothetical protein [Solirubrobacterales bacterium]
MAFIADAALLWFLLIGIFVLVSHHGSTEVTLEGAAQLNLDVNGDRWYLEGGSATLFGVAAAAVWVAYLGVLPGITGWTLGKRLTGVRVVGADGSPPGPGRGVVRAFAWVVDGFPYFAPGLVGFVVALSTQRRQRVGDQIGGTFVVRAGAAPEAEERVLAGDAAPASAAAGWYADPRGEERLRYWDGYNWTAHTAP